MRLSISFTPIWDVQLKEYLEFGKIDLLSYVLWHLLNSKLKFILLQLLWLYIISYDNTLLLIKILTIDKDFNCYANEDIITEIEEADQPFGIPSEIQDRCSTSMETLRDKIRDKIIENFCDVWKANYFCR